MNGLANSQIPDLKCVTVANLSSKIKSSKHPNYEKTFKTGQKLNAFATFRFCAFARAHSSKMPYLKWPHKKRVKVHIFTSIFKLKSCCVRSHSFLNNFGPPKKFIFPNVLTKVASYFLLNEIQAVFISVFARIRFRKKRKMRRKSWVIVTCDFALSFAFALLCKMTLFDLLKS